MSEKTFKQVCECKNCGNEAEMTITCSLKEEDKTKTPRVVSEADGKQRGNAVCSQCGGEASIWLSY